MVQPEEAPPVIPPARQTAFPILDAVAMPKNLLSDQSSMGLLSQKIHWSQLSPSSFRRYSISSQFPLLLTSSEIYL